MHKVVLFKELTIGWEERKVNQCPHSSPSPTGMGGPHGLLGVREAFLEEKEEAILEEEVGVVEGSLHCVSGPEWIDKAEWLSEGGLHERNQMRAGRTWLPAGWCGGQGRVPGPVWVS